MDLTFLRILAAGKLPRAVPPGPAFKLVLGYLANDYVEADIPVALRTRSGTRVQPDARVIGLTAKGQQAIHEPRLVSAELGG